MPQPIKNIDASYKAYPKCILERPKLAALLGAIAAEWGFIDHGLLEIFETAGNSEFQVDKIAIAIFDTLGSQGPKLDLIDTILKHKLPVEIQDRWNILRKKIRSLSGERNPLIHGYWMLTEKYPEDLILMPTSYEAIRYTEKDFIDVLDRVINLRNEIHEFVEVVYESPKKS